MAHVYREYVGGVLAHRDSAPGRFTFHDLVDDAVRAYLDLFAIAFVWLGHAEILPCRRLCTWYDTPCVCDVFVIGVGRCRRHAGIAGIGG